ncbi:MAG: hypothetical protein K0R75_2933 [Paenibacillaceae bacterium]|jgi:hypothetical protein|nr:hypothetical protein [Paenibacillaceae bacterium]
MSRQSPIIVHVDGSTVTKTSGFVAVFFYERFWMSDEK